MSPTPPEPPAFSLRGWTPRWHFGLRARTASPRGAGLQGRALTNLSARGRARPILAAAWLSQVLRQVLRQVLGPSQDSDQTLPSESCRSGEDTREGMSSFQGRELRGIQNGSTLTASLGGAPQAPRLLSGLGFRRSPWVPPVRPVSLTPEYHVESHVTALPSGRRAPRGLGTVSVWFITSPQPDRSLVCVGGGKGVGWVGGRTGS